MAGYKKNGPGCCGCGGGGGGGISTIPNCICTTAPTNVTMTSSNHSVNFGTYQDAAMTYTDVATTVSGIAVSGHAWYGTGTSTDPITGNHFFYKMTCLSNKFSLTYIWADGSNIGSDVGTLYTWLVGASGNSCTSFLLSNGTPAPGYGPVSVTIN